MLTIPFGSGFHRRVPNTPPALLRTRFAESHESNPMKFPTTLSLLALFALLCAPTLPRAEESKREIEIQGRTMGTTYHVKVVSEAPDLGDLARRIEARLAEINRSMSTYDPESEIGRFNRTVPANAPFPISGDFLEVMTVGLRLHRITDGAWDATVNPLVNLWGFGSRGEGYRIPSDEEIAAVLPVVGFQHIGISEDGFLVKRIPGVSLDLGSIAKGYGVDQIARVVAAAGYRDYIVEIGGEIYAAGRRPDGERWRIGISRPSPGGAPEDIYRVASLENRGFATSGDYRNFFVADGKRYSHVVDPRTGKAATNRVVSASVVAETCAFADGLATALMVMEPKKGLEAVNRLDGVECLVVVEGPGGELADHASEGFSELAAP
jgi:FAD:protein FMN transferase